MNDWKEFKCPNARLFFIKSTDENFDFHQMDRLLAEALAKAPRLATAHRYIDLYIDLKSCELQFGREVIGYNPLASQDESLYGYEILSMGKGFEKILPNILSMDLSELKESFKEEAGFADNLNISHFRIRFSWEKAQNEEIFLSAKAQILCGLL